jgi:hypothetical protein
VRCFPKNAVCSLAALLLFLVPVAAQVQVGDNVNLHLNGMLSSGYSGNYGDLIESSHSLTFGGYGNLNGFYYDPNFVTFDLTPYYNQSRDNSLSQSITNASGFNFSSGIFSASHFPGSISYSRSYNSTGSFGVPGLANFTTYGNNDTFGINWSALVPNMPTLSVGYQRGNSQYSIYGTSGNGNNDFQGFNVRSGYTLDGFNLSAYYTNSTGQAQFPELFGSSPQLEVTHSDSQSYGFGAGHSLPLRGQFSFNFNRSEMSDNFDGIGYSGTVDTVAAAAGIQPINKLHLSFAANYSDNLTGSLYQSAINAGAIVLQPSPNSSSNATDLTGTADYAFLPNLHVQGYVERRTQYFLGENFGANTYGGGVTYSHELLGGNLNAVAMVTDNTVDNNNLSSIGLTANTTYARYFGAWYVDGSFGYAQNAQTLLITYTTSYYNYAAHVRRHFGKLIWTGGASFSRSGLTALPGTASSSEGYSTSLGYKNWITATGSYANSNANGLLTAAGFTPTPLPVIIPSSLLILYGGHSYSMGVSSAPVRGLTLSGNFAHAMSNTLSTGLGSWNKNEIYNALIQYQFRKMYFTGGYDRLLQGFSVSPIPPARISSFYAGVSRWFNWF